MNEKNLIWPERQYCGSKFQIHWIWIRIQNFCPIWIRIRVLIKGWNRIRVWIQGYICYKFWREKNLKINFWRKTFFFNCKKIMAPEELFSQSSLWKVNLCLKSSTFCLILSYIFLCGSGSVFGIRIRIHKAPEYGSNTNADPDPQHCPKAKSCTGVRGQPKYLQLRLAQTRQTR